MHRRHSTAFALRWWAAPGAFVCAVCVTAAVRADGPALGAGPSALPGYARVPVVAAAERGVLLSGGLGYGLTESQVEAPGSHHRLGARAAASMTPLDWLDIAFATNLRHDRHSQRDELGQDDGTEIDSELYAQAGNQLGTDLHLGAGVRASFVRGSTLGQSLSSPALDLQLLAAYVPGGSKFSVGMLAGFRYDRRAHALQDPAQYRAGDRLALGSSAFNAVPLGLGASYRFGTTEVIGELSGDLLIGSGAPDTWASPWRASAGARQRLSDMLALRLMTEAALGARPATGADDPLAPVEPRFQVVAGLSYALLDWEPSLEALPAPPAPHLPPRAAPAPAPAAAPPALCTLQVNVWTAEGYPLSDASVELVAGQTKLSVPHRNLESYELAELAQGEAVVRVSAPRLKPRELRVTLRPGAPVTLDVRLDAAPQTGQVEGLVRSFGGKGLRARIRIEPLGTELTTDDGGRFVADVPPGHYEVLIEAAGHTRQRRQVEVTPDGVVILNADLVRTQ